MKINRRHNTDAFQFTVKARDLDCKQAIIDKITEAKDRGIKVRDRKDRPTCRLYFVCSQGKWRWFYGRIKSPCIVEPDVTCPCPAWLRKTILKNLRVTSQNGRVSPARAQRASQILAAIN